MPTSVQFLEQRDEQPREPRLDPPALAPTSAQAGKQRQRSSRGDRQQLVQRPGKSRAADSPPIARRMAKNRPRSAPVDWDDSDDDTPLDQLGWGRRSDVSFASTYDQPRRSERLLISTLRNTASATPEKADELEKTYDLTPHRYVTNGDHAALLQSTWHLPLTGYDVSVAPPETDEEQPGQEWVDTDGSEDESEDDAAERFTREDLPEWSQLIVGSIEGKLRRKQMEEDPPLQSNYVRRLKRKTTTKRVMGELRRVALTGVERSDVGFAEAAMHERWVRYVGWIDYQASLAKPERIEQQKQKGACSLPSRH